MSETGTQNKHTPPDKTKRKIKIKLLQALWVNTELNVKHLYERESSSLWLWLVKPISQVLSQLAK